MRKGITLFFALLVHWLCAQPVFTDSLKHQSLLSVPLSSSVSDCSSCRFSGFYPIGFSRDGLFAYFVEPVDEACGCYMAELVIRNLRNDSVVYYDYYCSDKGMFEAATGRTISRHIVFKNRDEYWVGMSDSLEKVMHNYFITPFADIENWHSTKAMLNDSLHYNMSFHTVAAPKSEFGYQYIDTIFVQSSKLSFAKSAFSTQLFQRLPPVRIEQVGYIKNKSSDDYAVILAMISNGWEGPPFVVDYRVIGCRTK